MKHCRTYCSTAAARQPDLNGNCHEGPALVADVSAAAAGAQLVIVTYIDIYHQLTLHRAEVYQGKSQQGQQDAHKTRE